MKLEKLKQDLLDAQKSIHRHELSIKKLHAKVAKIQQRLTQAQVANLEPEATLQRIIKIDANLRELHKNLLREFVATENTLDKEMNGARSNLIDYEIEIKLEYFLPESDPAYDEQSDNILTTRDVLFPYDYEQDGLKRVLKEIETDDFHDSPASAEYKQGYLSHDVVRHDYRYNHAIGEDGLLRVEDVWVDFVITRQYRMSLESGDYQKMSASK